MAQSHPPERSGENDRKIQREYVRYSGIGIEFAATIGVFGVAGWWLDGVTGLADDFPLFLLLGVFGGMFLGIYRMKLNLEGPPSKPDKNSGRGEDDAE